MGRLADRLATISADLKKEFPNIKIHTVAMSVTDTDAVQTLPQTLPKEFKNVDILVNNAGLALGVSPVQNNSVTDAQTVMNTNVIGTIAMCSAFIPGMIERNTGHIVNIGSVAG